MLQIRTADALEEVAAFARAAGCAVAVTPDAKGMYPEEEEAGFIGRSHHRWSPFE